MTSGRPLLTKLSRAEYFVEVSGSVIQHTEIGTGLESELHSWPATLSSRYHISAGKTVPVQYDSNPESMVITWRYNICTGKCKEKEESLLFGIFLSPWIGFIRRSQSHSAFPSKSYRISEKLCKVCISLKRTVPIFLPLLCYISRSLS